MMPNRKVLFTCLLWWWLQEAISVTAQQAFLRNTSSFAWIPAGRIVGGHEAEPHTAPWMVTMQWGATPTVTRHICGASIIRAHWVLTAAHCLNAVPALGTWLLLAGRHNLRAGESASEQRRPVVRRQTWRHPQSTSGRAAPFDVALIRVANPFDLQRGPHVRAIALPHKDDIPTGMAWLHGWGSTSMTSAPVNPLALQRVVKPILQWADCYRALGADSPLHWTNVCTGPLTGGVSACSGDSGGPVTQGGVVVGVVSWGRVPCGSVNSPSVHGRISAFVDWIEDVMKRNA